MYGQTGAGKTYSMIGSKNIIIENTMYNSL